MKAWLAFFGFGWSEWKLHLDEGKIINKNGGSVGEFQVYIRTNKYTNLPEFKRITKYNVYWG